MTYFLWTADLVTGNKGVDADHYKLTLLVDSLITACERGASVGTISLEFDNLVAFAKEHFEQEESDMLRIGYSGRDLHMADHAKLLNDVKDLKAKLDSGQQIRPLEIYDFIKTWLHEHILNFDMPMVAAGENFARSQHP